MQQPTELVRDEVRAIALKQASGQPLTQEDLDVLAGAGILKMRELGIRGTPAAKVAAEIIAGTVSKLAVG